MKIHLNSLHNENLKKLVIGMDSVMIMYEHFGNVITVVLCYVM